MIDDTAKEKTAIMETSYIITGNFFMANFDEQLNTALNIASELELPEHHVSRDIFKLWKKLKKNIWELFKIKLLIKKPLEGIEPSAPWLRIKCSTTELQRRL